MTHWCYLGLNISIWQAGGIEEVQIDTVTFLWNLSPFLRFFLTFRTWVGICEVLSIMGVSRLLLHVQVCSCLQIKWRKKRGYIHTVRGRLGSPRTPMIAFSSVIVTCLARSTAWATCCWCCRTQTHSSLLEWKFCRTTPSYQVKIKNKRSREILVNEFNYYCNDQDTWLKSLFLPFIKCMTLRFFITLFYPSDTLVPHLKSSKLLLELTSCDKNGIIWARIALRRLAISVCRRRKEGNVRQIKHQPRTTL